MGGLKGTGVLFGGCGGSELGFEDELKLVNGGFLNDKSVPEFDSKVEPKVESVGEQLEL